MVGMDIAPSIENKRVRPDIIPVDSEMKLSNHLDHFLARWGYRRGDHRALPGLYALGNANKSSPVFVTANYTLSFDALRSALKGTDCYILVLNTYGINVWCAAGKGTFGTGELVNRIKATGLDSVVDHRKIILPQLGAPGVDAFEIKRQTGFKVEYGPVRAKDIQEYLKLGTATPEMRRVKFRLWDRAVLIPVELTAVLLWTMLITAGLFFVGSKIYAGAALSSVLAGTVLFPILLPQLPTKDFTTKGLILGLLVALPFAAASYMGHQGSSILAQALIPITFMLIMPPITAFLALNFTGATPFTSRTGVRTEIYRYIPFIAGMFALGVIVDILLSLSKFMGVM